jgi:hypothetical protein
MPDKVSRDWGTGKETAEPLGPLAIKPSGAKWGLLEIAREVAIERMNLLYRQEIWNDAPTLSKKTSSPLILLVEFVCRDTHEPLALLRQLAANGLAVQILPKGHSRLAVSGCRDR